MMQNLQYFNKFPIVTLVFIILYHMIPVVFYVKSDTDVKKFISSKTLL